MSAESEGDARVGERAPGLAVAGLHLAALSAFALAQPLFDLLGKNPDFLAAHGVTGWEMVLLGLVLVLALPLVLLALEALASLAGRAPRVVVHLVFVAALVALIAVQVLKKSTGIHSSALVMMAAVVGVLAALLYARARGLRSFLSVLSPVPLLFLVIFLFFSDANDLTFASSSAKTANVSSRVPVVFVMLDEVSTISFEDGRRRIDPVRYPNLARFAADGTWYRNATAPTDTTTTAAPAILSGSLPPKSHHVPILSNYPHNLFTLLGRRYRMKVSQEATDLCPAGLCVDTGSPGAGAKEKALASDLGLIYLHQIAPHDLERHLDPVSNTIGNFSGGEGTKTTSPSGTGHRGKKEVGRELGGGRPARFERFVAAIDRTTRPTLYFKHSLLPHVPWQYLPSGRRYLRKPHEAIADLTDEPSWHNDYLLAQAYQRHLLQAGFVDNLLGTLMRRLREKHLYDRALIVVTADNGESFLHPDNPHEVTEGNIEDIADTPFFIKLPGQQRGRIVDRHVRTIDILPTLADAIGVRLPWRVDGRSVLHGTADIPQRVELFERSGRRLVLSLAEYKRRIQASLERKLRLFGSGKGGPGLYGLGPQRELIGSSLTALHPARAGAAAARVNGAGEYRAVDLRSDFVPAQVTGSLQGAGAGQVRDVAVALNGRIVGTGQVFSLSGQRPSFSVIVPDSVFRQGRNKLQVLSVSGAPGAPRLTTLATVD
jgi:Sulfatase